MTTDSEPIPDAPEQPPPGVGTMAIIRWALLALTLVAAVAAWRGAFFGAPPAAAASVRYQCPMHPQIIQDTPGDCPICHMHLEPISNDRRAAKPPAAASGAPSGSATEPQHPPGTAPISLSLDRLQSIGVRTAEVLEKPALGGLRVTASVIAPERGTAEVHVRSAGFVEAIGVKETGVKVKAGQWLLSVYSPEVYQAQSELLATRDWPSLGVGGAAGSTDRQSGSTRKLELLGFPTSASARVLASGKPERAVGVSSPISGYVTKKNAVLGSYVAPEMLLYEIVDLSSVYVVAEVFQQDARTVQVGLAGTFTLANRPTEPIPVKVDLIYPNLDGAARTVRARMTVDNTKLGLLPGEYGYADFTGSQRTALFVPRDSIVDTGDATYVFLQTAPGEFAPRSITIGEANGEFVEVTAGVAKGARVVSGATFLIDSESRLQASIADAEGR